MWFDLLGRSTARRLSSHYDKINADHDADDVCLDDGRFFDRVHRAAFPSPGQKRHAHDHQSIRFLPRLTENKTKFHFLRAHSRLECAIFIIFTSQGAYNQFFIRANELPTEMDQANARRVVMAIHVKLRSYACNIE